MKKILFIALAAMVVLMATIMAIGYSTRVSAAEGTQSDKPMTTGFTVTLIPETTEVEIVKPFEIKGLDYTTPPAPGRIKKGPGHLLSEGRITIKNISTESYRADLSFRPIRTGVIYPELGVNYGKTVAGTRTAGPLVLKPGEEGTLAFKVTINWGNVPLTTFKGLEMDVFANPPTIEGKG